MSGKIIQTINNERQGDILKFEPLTVSMEGAVLFAEISAPPMNLLGAVVERAVILSDRETLSVDRTWLKRQAPQVSRDVRTQDGVLSRDTERERALIEAALAESGGQIAGAAGAARKLGIPRQTLDSKIRSLGIDKLRFRRR